MKLLRRQRLLTSTMMAGVASALAATSVLAQEPVTEVEAIVVTGSRIPQINLETTSPVTQVTGEDIDVAGVTRVEDLITQLPPRTPRYRTVPRVRRR